MNTRPKAAHPVWLVPDDFITEIATGLGTTPDKIRRDMAIAIDAGYLRVINYADHVDIEGTFPGDVCP